MNRIKWLDRGLVVLVVILSTTTYILTRQNQSLKEKISSLVNPLSGAELPDEWQALPFIVRRLNDQIDTINIAKQHTPTLFFVFNTSCPHCEHNLAIWNMIVHNLDPNICGALGLSTDGLDMTREYVKRNNVPFRVVTIIDSTFRSDYKLGGIPQTFLISHDGIVKSVWRGRLQTDDIERILEKISALSKI